MVGGRFLEQLRPIQRFVIGLDRPEAETTGYILSHPKLCIHLREAHFDPEYIQATQAAFVGWGQKTVARLNRGALRPEDTPAYLVQYHTQHLQDAAAPAEAFLDLVEQGWLAWETLEGGYRGFSRTCVWRMRRSQGPYRRPATLRPATTVPAGAEFDPQYR